MNSHRQPPVHLIDYASMTGRNVRLPTVSVVIPTLDENENIASCIRSVLGAHVLEVIVADGGSRDETVALAHALGAQVVKAPRGRASQMNAGAAIARGDVLLFLHADCTLEAGAIGRLRRAMRRGQHSFGYFRQRIAGGNVLYRFQEMGSSIRARVLARPYGDQAIFCRREVFESIGRYPEVAIMEDLYLARAARRYRPFLVMPDAVTSSPRRWEADGFLRRSLRNWSVAIAEQFGCPPAELLLRYEGIDPASLPAHLRSHKDAGARNRRPAPMV